MLDASLTPDILNQLYQQLTADFPRDALQSSDLDEDFSALGIRAGWIFARLNNVLGPAHWRYHENGLHVEPTATGAYEAVAKVTVEFGNPHYLAETGTSAWEVIATRFAYGKFADADRGEAMQGAVTNAFKKAVALLGPGYQAYIGKLDDKRRPGTPVVTIPTGPFEARIHGGKYQTIQENEKLSGRFEGQLHILAQDAMVPIAAMGQPAMLLETLSKSQSPCEVTLDPTAHAGIYTVTTVVVPEAASAHPPTNDTPATPAPIPFDKQKMENAQQLAAKAGIDWPVIRTAFATNNGFASADDASAYLDGLNVLTTAKTKLASLAARIKSMAPYDTLVQLAHRVGYGEEEALAILYQQSPQTPVENLAPHHYQTAAKQLLQVLLEQTSAKNHQSQAQ